MSEKDTTQPPGYINWAPITPVTQPAMQIQQPTTLFTTAQPQSGVGFQSGMTQVPGNVGNVAYPPQVYPQGAMPQQPMQPQPMQPQPMQPQPMQPQPTGGTYPQPGGAYPQLGVAYPQPNNGYPMLPGGQMRDFTPQQPVGAPPVYHTAVPIMTLTQGAAPVDCPCCRRRAVTKTDYQAGSTTHLWAIILCLFTGLPCIPYLMNSSKDVKHSCSNCGVHLATWNRGGNTQVFQHG